MALRNLVVLLGDWSHYIHNTISKWVESLKGKGHLQMLETNIKSIIFMSSGFESIFKEGMKSLNKRGKTDMLTALK